MKKKAESRASGTEPKRDFQAVFARLRQTLQKHSAGLVVTTDAPGHYCLEGTPGPAALQAWGGKARRPTIHVAWARIEKAYVSYHLMAVYAETRLLAGISKELKARMQGKSCFNFKVVDEAVFKELDRLTELGIAGFRKAGFIVEGSLAS